MKLKELKGFVKEEVEKIGIEKIKKYADELRKSKNYKDFETRLCFDVYYAIPSKKTDSFSEFGKTKKRLNGNDAHLKTLIKSVLKEFKIL